MASESEFVPRLNETRILVRRPSWEGIAPSKLFCDRSSSAILVQRPSWVGIVLVKPPLAHSVA